MEEVDLQRPLLTIDDDDVEQKPKKGIEVDGEEDSESVASDAVVADDAVQADVNDDDILPGSQRRVSAFNLDQFDVLLSDDEEDEEDNVNNNDDKSATQTAGSPNPKKIVAITGMDLLHDKISKVEKSWLLISQQNRIGAVGLKFFLRMLDEYPDLVQLFPFGEDAVDRSTGQLKLNAYTKRHVQAHASAVMRVVGTCVAGLTSLEDLIPRLRSVGATHKRVGVQNMHYDILYRHLIRAIREEVGPENWDEETEDAWEQAYLSITDLIKQPSKRLETEPLHGWGAIMLLACIYFTIVTPIRFAGFLLDELMSF